MFKGLFSKNKKYKTLKLLKPKNSFLKYRDELLGILIFSFCIILTLSFISYRATDNSWFYFSSGKTVTQNWIGVVGANFASLFFYLFGSAAYFLNILLLFGLSKRFNESDGFFMELLS